MTLELDVDDTYLEMLDRIEEEREGDVRSDIARVVEGVIHENFQQVRSGGQAQQQPEEIPQTRP